MIRRTGKVPCLAAVTRAAAIAMLIVVAGCAGERGEADLSDVDVVLSLVSSAPGAAGEPDRERWERLFVEGAAPEDAERAKYAALEFRRFREKVDVSGTTATAPVAARKLGDDDQPFGEPVEWEFVKEGGAWKIKNAPLPSGA